MDRWTVKIVKEPNPGHFQAGYFPRGFHYKADAQKLVNEVEDHGGEAVVVPKKYPRGAR